MQKQTLNKVRLVNLAQSLLALLAIFILTAISAKAFAAGETAQTFSLDGQLFSDASGKNPLIDNSQVVFQILDQTQTCILYEETQDVDTTASNGYFTVLIGSAVGAGKRSGNDSAHNMQTVYTNTGGAIAGKLISNGAVCSYTPTLGDERFVRIQVTPSDNVTRLLSPNLAMDSVPTAVVAERAESIQGLAPASLLQVNTTAPANLSQTNLESIFSVTNFPRLTTMLAVPPTNYIQLGTNGSVAIPEVAGQPGSGLTAGQVWYDSTGNVMQYYNGTTVETLGTGTGTVTSITAGTGLLGGTITSSGTIAVDVGTTAGQIVQVQTGGKLPALDGSNLTNLNGSSINSGTVGGNTAINTTGSIVAGSLSGSTVSSRTFDFYNTGNTFFVSMQAPGALGANYALTLPGNAGSPGQILTTDGAGVLSWTTASSGTVTSVGVSPPITTTGGTAPTIGITQSTTSTDGYLSSTDWNAFNNKESTALTNGHVWVGNSSNVATDVAMTGDTSISNAGAVTVNKFQTVPLVITSLTTANYLRYNGTDWVNSNLVSADIIGGLGYTPINPGQMPASCGANETLTFSSPTGMWACSNILIDGSAFGSQSQNLALLSPNGSSGNPTFRAIATADLPITGASGVFINGGNSFGQTATLGTTDNNQLNIVANNVNAMTILPNGNVGVGATTPGAPLHVYSNVNAGTYSIFEAGTVFNGNYKLASFRGNGTEYGFISPAQFFMNDNNGAGGMQNKITLRGTANLAPNIYGYAYNGDRIGVYGIDAGTAGSGAGVVGQSTHNPAMIAESLGTINDAFIASSETLTSGRLAYFEQNTSAFTGDALQMNLGQGTGSFSGNFLNLENNSSSKFVVTSAGNTGIAGVAPNTALDVNGALSMRAMVAPVVSPATQGRIYFDSTSNQFMVSQNGGAYAALATTGGSGGGTNSTTSETFNSNSDGSGNDGGFNFQSNGVNLLTIDNSGNTTITGNTTISGSSTFTTGTGNVTLNGATTVAANQNLAMTSGTGQFSQTYSGAGPAAAITTVSSGHGDTLDINSTTTASASNDTGLNIAVSGANGTTAVTRYGLQSSVTNTNATSGTNIAGYFSASGATTANYGLIVANGNVGIGTNVPSDSLTIQSGAEYDGFQLDKSAGVHIATIHGNANGNDDGTLALLDQGNTRILLDARAGISYAPHSTSGANRSLLTLTGAADLANTSAENNDVDFNLARTVQFATGALAMQRAFYIQAPAYSFVGASTLTSTSTLDISGPPQSQTNATITNAYGLNIEAGAVQPAGTVTNATGLAVNAPTGATNNYAATFSGGNVGIGTTAPANQLNVMSPTGSPPIMSLASTDFSSPMAIGNDYKGVFVATAESHSQGGAILYGSSFGGTTSALLMQGIVVQSGATSIPATVLSGAKWSGGGSPTSLAAEDQLLQVQNYDHTPYLTVLGSGNVGIGQTNPGTKLEIDGANGTTLKIVDTNQGVGKVLTSDANGNASWQSASGVNLTTDTFNDGTAGAPTINFSGDTTTGLYQGGAGVIGFTSAGTSIGTWGSAGLTIAGAGALTTGTGNVTLNGATTVAANKNLTMTSGTGKFAQTYSGTGPAAAITTISNGSGDTLDVTASTNNPNSGDKALSVSVSGTNISSGYTRYGVYSNVTATNGTSGTNVAGYFSATGANMTNYGLVVPNGYVGIGTATPASLLNLSGSLSSTTSWTTTGLDFAVGAATLTDNSSTATVTTRAANSVGTPTFASNVAQTTTTGATLYIAGAPAQGANETITNTYALDVAAGNAYFGGNISVGGIPATSDISLYINNNQTNPSSTLEAIKVLNRSVSTSAPTQNAFGTVINDQPNIASGVTSTFTDMGLYVLAERNQYLTGDSGTESAVVGFDLLFGHNNNDVSATPQTGAVYGIKLEPQVYTGTITGNMYDLYVTATATGGTISGNHFGIYQNDSDAKNYFSGNVGIGTANPSALLMISNSTTGTPTSTGTQLSVWGSTFTDNNTAGSGTAGSAAFSNFAAPTLAATNTSVTTTNASTLRAGGAPTAGTNETITNSSAILVNGATLTGTITNSYGLNVNAQSGASNNYAATFAGGNVGIGTATPAQPLDVAGNINAGSQTTRTTTTSRGQLASGSTYYQNQASSVTVNWNYGNIQEVNAFVCNGSNTITMSNLRDGAAYSLLLSGSTAHSGTCVFSAAGFTFKTSGGAVAPATGHDILFTFGVINSTVVYSMSDNLQ